jgi:hypothetical protein
MSISAMKQALQALDLIDKDIEWHDKSPTRKFCNQAAHFLRQAIAEAEQPDLARVGEVGIWGDKREWVGLHEHELQVLEYNDPSGERLKLAKAVEAKLKGKNT